MPRKPRMYLAGVPAHVIQRGNNRNACFFHEDDNRFFLQCLGNACERNRVALHAYVLMTNHTHLLMTPERADGISRVMQSVGRRYVQYINKTYRRTGTLWESRHKASLVDAENYLLACYRYIELNPVRAGMVAHPGEYRWSSYRAHAYGESSPMLTAHPVFRALATNPEQRADAYRELFHVDLDAKLLHEIRQSSTFSTPLGNDRFRKQVEWVLARAKG